MTNKNTSSKKQKATVLKVESEIVCKATAALEKQIAQELNEEDKPLEELMTDEETKSKE